MTIAFGGTFVATKVALRGFEPLLIAFVRFVVAGAILWLVWRRRGEREAVTRRELGRLAALGFVSLTVYFTFENVGIAHTSASDAAILIATVPIFVLIVNAVTTREHTSGGQWLGVALSFAGVVALVELGRGEWRAHRWAVTCWCWRPRWRAPCTRSWRDVCWSRARHCS